MRCGRPLIIVKIAGLPRLRITSTGYAAGIFNRGQPGARGVAVFRGIGRRRACPGFIGLAFQLTLTKREFLLLV